MLNVKKAIDLELQKLNDQQREVVLSDGNTLVVAGPGSGKTYTLSVRTAYLVENGIEPKNIILLTFTRKAAKEILDRTKKIIQNSTKLRDADFFAGTFHSFCYNMIKSDKNLISKYNEYNIIDEEDANSIIKEIYKDIPNSEKNLLNKYGLSYDDVFYIIEQSKNRLETIYQSIRNYATLLNIQDIDTDIEEISKIIHAIEQNYKLKKEKMRKLDYNDLLLYVYNYLKDNEAARFFWGKDKYIMIDEYQDTNRLQFYIIKYLSENNNQVMAVGDDCQSIYKFRGATYENMKYFMEEMQNPKLLYLMYNYRSAKSVIEISNKFIKNMKIFYDKEIIVTRKERGYVECRQFRNREEQAFFVSNFIKNIIENQGIKPKEIAVLYRNNYNSYELEAYLNRLNIKYKKYGGLKLTQQRHVKDFFAFLLILINKNDEVSWIRLLSSIPGIGEVKASKLIPHIVEEYNYKEILRIANKSPHTIMYLNMLIEYYKENSENVKFLPAYEIVNKMLPVYRKFFELKYNEDTHRYKTIMTLAELSKKFYEVKDFINKIFINDTDLEEEHEKNSDDYIVLSTVHSAKGLEFEYVFVISVDTPIFPSLNKLISDLEEEKRLFFVAITRAKNNLFICTSNNKELNYEESFFKFCYENI